METVTETTTESETGTPVHRGTVRLFDKTRPLLLECGQPLAPVEVAYETYGRLNAEKSNAVLLLHALTGNARAATFGAAAPEPSGWWNGVIGRGRALDPGRYFLI
ncbi:MAG: homoserine O-acetyltransferase, partial [candidate division KSB1 bacterium]|nr:homoserine O-acetyltransferase [candidate division KSB1 bacterium]